MVLGITPNTKFVYSLKPPVELVVHDLVISLYNNKKKKDYQGNV